MRTDQGREATVGPRDTINTAYNRMRAGDVWQPPATADPAALLPLFRADKVAIVEDAAARFLGVVTEVDLINHQRRKLG